MAFKTTNHMFIVTLMIVCAVVLSSTPSCDAARLPAKCTPICPACVCCTPAPKCSCCSCCAGPIDVQSSRATP
ncbi:hypothetical protein BVRB_9g211920 [Beta vulgaris subsp. vulgaris]|nr:hypothetical protein BVRB_9g211920 [Beta vulgaris subsp. vulgaris]